jgi:hypothetical protein
LLVAGCWLLVAGCWLLVAGCWLLVKTDTKSLFEINKKLSKITTGFSLDLAKPLFNFLPKLRSLVYIHILSNKTA